jgi:3-dehydroquinate dehydratase
MHNASARAWYETPMSIGAGAPTAKKTISAIEKRNQELKKKREKLRALRDQAGEMINTLRTDKKNADIAVDQREQAARLMSAVMNTLVERIDAAYDTANEPQK